MERKLYKSRTDVKLDGVCAGVAKYFNWDATLIRLLWVVLTLAGGSGILLYIICALIMPREPKDYVDYNDYNDRSN